MKAQIGFSTPFGSGKFRGNNLVRDAQGFLAEDCRNRQTARMARMMHTNKIRSLVWFTPNRTMSYTVSTATAAAISNNAIPVSRFVTEMSSSRQLMQLAVPIDSVGILKKRMLKNSIQAIGFRCWHLLRNPIFRSLDEGRKQQPALAMCDMGQSLSQRVHGTLHEAMALRAPARRTKRMCPASVLEVRGF